MSYQVLARKWRPRNFSQMVGQDHLLRALSNALQLGRLHHAYLFTGTRGVGKTTVARILAKCLNCEVGVTATPCGVCQSCTEIDSGRFLDLIEVDAASRTKVEDTRDLLDNVMYMPSRGRYKVYLIDEVHMLSGHSFNALLKTLEEPPSHVKFLLATTDPDKLPVTVLSRCLQLHLKRVLPETIAAHLETILQAENIQYEAAALSILSKAADGSVRDALSLLDQAIVFCHGLITEALVRDMLGVTSSSAIECIVQQIIASDVAGLLQTIAELAQTTVDFQHILEEVISYFHQLAIAQAVPAAALENASLIALASKITASDVQLCYQIGLLGRRDIALATTSREGLEMTLLRMILFRPQSVDVTRVTPVVAATVKVPDVTQVKVMPSSQPKQDMPSQASPNPAPIPEPKARAPVPELSLDWMQVIANLNLTGPTLQLANNCAIKEFEENRLALTLAPEHQPLLNPMQQQRLEKSISEYYQRPIKVTLTVAKDTTATPAVIANEQHQEKLKIAHTDLLADKSLQSLLRTFNTELHLEAVKIGADEV